MKRLESLVNASDCETEKQVDNVVTGPNTRTEYLIGLILIRPPVGLEVSFHLSGWPPEISRNFKEKAPKCLSARSTHRDLDVRGLFIIRLVEGATRFLVGADKDFRNCLSARWKKLLLHEKMPLLAPNSQRPTSLYTNIFFLLHLLHVSPRPGDVTFLKRSAFFYIQNSSFFW